MSYILCNLVVCMQAVFIEWSGAGMKEFMYLTKIPQVVKGDEDAQES